MGTEPKWFLLFLIVGATLCRDVAGRLVQGPNSLQYTIIDYSEEDKGGARRETTNNEMVTILSAMDMFAETVNKKFDSLISDRNDLKQDIKQVIDHIVIEQTENISLHITNKIDRHLKKNTAIIRMMINLELNEMKSDMRAVLQKIDKSENNMRKEIEGLSNKINLLADVIQNSKQETNCNNSKDEIESFETTTEKQFIEITTEQQKMIKDIISREDRNKQAISITPNIDVSKQNASEFTSLCDLDIPEAIKKAGQRSWDTYWKPLTDDLDLFVMNKTGCTFTSLSPFNEPPLMYDGSLFEWRGALRAAENGDIVVNWADHAVYTFYIGLEGNRDTVFIKSSPWTDLVRRRTPEILSADRYVPFYIKIQEGVLTFGHECESEPMFTYDVSVAAGDPVYVSYYPYGPGGGTARLYQCPPAARVPPALEMREEKQQKDKTIVTKPVPVETTTEEQFTETTTEQQNRIKDIISREDRNKQAISITPNIDVSKQNASEFTSLCDLDIPESIKKAGQRSWDTYWKPLTDDLDLFVMNKTGCTFTSLKNREPFYEPPLMYDGSLFEWRGALRAAENGDIVVQWADHAGYAFYIGLEGNRDTVFIQRSPWTDLVRRRTPGILSADRYVPFYIKIQEGVLTFGHECESEPMFTYDVSVAAGDPVYVSYYPFGPGGGKHLYQCPPAARVQPALSKPEEKQQKEETVTEIVTEPVPVETTTEEQFTETTTEQLNRIKDIISRQERNRQAISITPNIDVSNQNASKFTSLCDLDIPEAIKRDELNTWNTYLKPLTDELDLFVMNRTGCTFTSIKNREPFYEPPVMYDGSLFEWRGALRAAENGNIVVQWADHAGYAFYMGLEGNRDTVFIQRSPWTELVRRRTPGILFADRYVPFYIRIQDGVLTFGHECESEPMFTYDVSVAAGDPVYVSYYPFGPGGGKHLYQCPPAARAQPAREPGEEKQQKEETPTEVVVEIVTEPITESVTKPVTEPDTGLVTEFVTKRVTEIVTEPVTELVTKRVTEIVTEPVTELVTKRVTEIVTEPVTELLTGPVTERITATVTGLVTEHVTEPVTELVTKPVTEIVTESVTKPVTEPLIELVTESVSETVTETDTVVTVTDIETVPDTQTELAGW